MSKTETVEALLNPSLRVSRPVAACARCRSAKIKCDGKLPSCSACERSGKAASCSAANDDFARGKERSYVAALEGAAARLQKRIDELRSQPNVRSPGQKATASQLERPAQKRIVSGGQRKEALDVDELVSDFGFLTVNATSRDFHGFTSSMSFARLLLSASTTPSLPTPRFPQMPPRQAIMPLVQHYLDNIYVLLPFFSETEFMTSLSKVYEEYRFTPVAPLDYWYVRLVLAISAASQSLDIADEFAQIALEHAGAAMEYAEYVLHPGSIAGVQALLLLVQYALVDPEHFDSWYLIGMACRLMVDLGLHCEPGLEAKISRNARDLRRRIFYTAYTLDRQISMSLGRAFSFTDDSAPGVPLPTLATNVEKQSPSQLFLRSLKPSLFLFDIRRVQSSYYQLMRWSSRSAFDQSEATNYSASMLKDISSWHSMIPPTLSPAHLSLFNLELLYSQILVIAPNQRNPVQNITENHQGLIFEYSCRFAETMQPLIKNIRLHAFWTFSDACRSRYVGRQFLEVMWANLDQLLRSQHIMSGIANSTTITPLDNCVRAIGCLWKITEILEFAGRRWSSMDLRDKFEKESAVLLGRLKNRQQEYSTQYSSTNLSTTPLYTGTQPSTYLTLTHSPPEQWSNNYMDVGTGGSGQYLPPTAQMNLPRPGYFRSSPGVSEESAYGFPPGTLPRRSYEFRGG